MANRSVCFSVAFHFYSPRIAFVPLALYNSTPLGRSHRALIFRTWYDCSPLLGTHVYLNSKKRFFLISTTNWGKKPTTEKKLANQMKRITGKGSEHDSIAQPAFNQHTHFLLWRDSLHFSGPTKIHLKMDKRIFVFRSQSAWFRKPVKQMGKKIKNR